LFWRPQTILPSYIAAVSIDRIVLLFLFVNRCEKIFFKRLSLLGFPIHIINRDSRAYYFLDFPLIPQMVRDAEKRTRDAQNAKRDGMTVVFHLCVPSVNKKRGESIPCTIVRLSIEAWIVRVVIF
jgi:hypothetical protein